MVADRYPNFSVCGIPYYLSGEVTDWHRLAHRTIPELESTGMRLLLDTVARRIDAGAAARARHARRRGRAMAEL